MVRMAARRDRPGCGARLRLDSFSEAIVGPAAHRSDCHYRTMKRTFGGEQSQLQERGKCDVHQNAGQR